MTYLDTLDDCDELIADRKHAVRLRNLLARHPNPQDPDHPIDCEARAEAEPDPLEALIAFVRAQCEKAEKHLEAGRRENAVLAMHDADFEIAKATGLS